MMLLSGFRVLQIGPGLAAAVCGRLLADVGATVTRIDADVATPLADHLNHDPSPAAATFAPAVPASTTLAAATPAAAPASVAPTPVAPAPSHPPPVAPAPAAPAPAAPSLVSVAPAASAIEDDAWAAADLIVCQGSPAELRRAGCDPDSLRRRNARAALVLISPFGQTGPQAEQPATDLTLMFASGIARMLTGQVDDLGEPPMPPVGQQSAFIGGLAAACAGMHAALLDPAPRPGAGSIPNRPDPDAAALATLAITELTRAGQTQTSQTPTDKTPASQTQTDETPADRSWSRQRVADGNGATVCILPASDGFAAISPREDRQWAAWLQVMGQPAWGAEPRFATRQHRVANWDALHALMADWSRDKPKQWIAAAAQAAHVPSFALCEPAEHLASAQLRQRGFFRSATLAGHTLQVPGAPFVVQLTRPIEPPTRPTEAATAGPLPLSGVRVLDFSWVIAGPTATRYLAAMGAEVIKIEAPGPGDPGRASELHSVLGQAKQAIVLNLKHPQAVAIARALAAGADVLVENFATGVMDRLGLGPDALRAINPNLIYVSASGLGRDGPQAHAVAYGTLLQCYAGFAGLNRHPDVPPRVGMAWLDPMCGLLLAFITAASLWRRHRGGVARVDFSMLEAMLWTMAEPLLAEQLHAASPRPANTRPPGAVYRTAGADDWLAVDPAPETPPSLCDAAAAVATLTRGGAAAAALARSADLVNSDHLRARGFWHPNATGLLPGLPWHASFGHASGPAPALGADTQAVLSRILGLSPDEIRRLREAAAIG